MKTFEKVYEKAYGEACTQDGGPFQRAAKLAGIKAVIKAARATDPVREKLREALEIAKEYVLEALTECERIYGEESPRCNLDRAYFRQIVAALALREKEEK